MIVAAPVLERALRRDRTLVAAGLISVIAGGWAYTLSGAGMNLAVPSGASLATLSLTFAMWWVMMAAMMLPAAAPTILLFAAVNRKSGERGHPIVPAAVFAAGYLAAWGGFSAVATLAQAVLEQSGLLTPMLSSAGAYLGAALLIAAGAYQMTPLKHACLRHCRAPHDFIARRWRQGGGGALRMGLEHGAFCLGCCWVLMGLLFYGGVMSPLWIAGLALYVMVEKLAPAGHWLGRFSGLALIAWGAAVALDASI